jgi:hypothetical protein
MSGSSTTYATPTAAAYERYLGQLSRVEALRPAAADYEAAVQQLERDEQLLAAAPVAGFDDAAAKLAYVEAVFRRDPALIEPAAITTLRDWVERLRSPAA